MSFEQGTGLFGVCVLGIVGGGIWGVKKLLPEVELRLELTVLFSLFLFAGIVVCPVLHPSVQVVPAIRTANWRQTLEVAGVMLFLIFGGFILRKWRNCKKMKFRK